MKTPPTAEFLQFHIWKRRNPGRLKHIAAETGYSVQMVSDVCSRRRKTASGTVEAALRKYGVPGWTA